jgi:2'-5' RNA ligase
MRLFIAVDLDERARRRVWGTVSRLRRQCREISRDLVHVLRWKAPASLHLTVHFLGEVGVRRLPALRAALAQPLHLAPFDVEFGGLGVFPTDGEPRVVRLVIASGAGGLAAMHYELGTRLGKIGFQVEARPYTPHLTLARIRSSTSVSLGAVFDTLSIDPIGPSRIDHADLYRSQASPAGSTYASVLRIPLAP